MASRIPEVLVDGVFIPSTQGVLVAAQTGERYTITRAWAINSSTATQTFTLYRVGRGQEALRQKLLVKDRGVAVGQPVPITELVGAVLRPLDFIEAVASAADAISIQVFASRYVS